jgi:serine/threonine-protein kinase
MLEGRYLLRAPLGRGGMGMVWRAEHVKLGSEVAIKLLAPSIAASTDAIERFRREARLAAALDSANIVRISDFGVDSGAAYIAMELLQGETLGARLARRGALTPSETAVIVQQIARGVGRAHESSVVHCDLKPENVFIARVDGDDVAKVLDFGVAKALDLDPLTQTGAVLGTFQYMSPEQLRGRRQIDARSDLYSLAVIAFECLCGTAPFRGDSIGELVTQICVEPLPIPSNVASVPRAFDAWFARAAHRDPAERFASAKEMSVALSAAIADAPKPSATPSARPSPHALAATEGASASDTADAGFRVTTDLNARLVTIERWGMWDEAVARRFANEQKAAMARLAGAPWVALALATRHPAQSAEVQAIDAETMGAAGPMGMARVAFVLDSAVARMMARRLATENEMPNARFFDSEAAARAWLFDAPELTRRGGGERAGFSVHANPYTRRLTLGFWGMWDVATARAFGNEVLRGYERMRGRPWVALSNARKYPPQKADVQAIHSEAIGRAFTFGLVRVAVLVDTALSQMQIRRLFEEAGSPPNLRFTSDEAEANAFLAEAKLG